MKFAIVDHSTDSAVDPLVLAAIADALHSQLLDVCAEWGAAGEINVRLASGPADVGADEVPACIFDDADAPGVLGYHDRDPQGRAYVRVFWAPIKAAGGTLTTGAVSLSCTLSHELCETVGDPSANFWCDRGDGTEEALELCDRVEDQSYAIAAVAVSDFLLRAAFDPGAPPPFDRMGALQHATDVVPGGYVILRQVGADLPSQARGAIAEHKRASKAAPGSRSHRRGVRLSSVP